MGLPKRPVSPIKRRVALLYCLPMPERERLSAERLTESGETEAETAETVPDFAVDMEARRTEQEASAEHDRERAAAARARVRRAVPRGEARPLGDWAGTELRGGRIALTEAQGREYARKAEAFFVEVKDSKMATDKGYQVAGAYDVRVQGWTTRSTIVEVEGKRVFVLCSFPAGATRRRFDRLMETLSGDPMRKPTPEGWKLTVESRSEIPTIAGTRPDMVAMPYLEVMNAYDLFAHQKDVRDFGPFGWAEEAGVADKLALVGPIAGALKGLHGKGKTWGEAILPNVVLDQERRPTFVDPETTYEGITDVEQRARDIRTLIGSVAGALARGDGYRDFQAVANLVLEGYGDDPETLEALDRFCARPMPFRQKLTFGFWGKFRVGATDGAEYEEVRLAIRAAIAERRQA